MDITIEAIQNIFKGYTNQIFLISKDKKRLTKMIIYRLIIFLTKKLLKNIQKIYS